jgi:hypothetical protein
MRILKKKDPAFLGKRGLYCQIQTEFYQRFNMRGKIFNRLKLPVILCDTEFP